MDKIIDSKALKANLEQLGNVKIVIPDEHLWFLNLSKDYWGIYKRTEEFLLEFHHPYSNREDIVENLNKLAIGDFWVFKKSSEPDKAIDIILNVFDTLLGEDLSNVLLKQLVYNYLNFFSTNESEFVEDEILFKNYIDILDKHFKDKYFSYIGNIRYFLKIFNSADKATTNSNIRKFAFQFLHKLILKNISFWQETTDIEQWYKDKLSVMSDDYWETVRTLGKDFFHNYHENVIKTKTIQELCNNAFTFSDIIEAFRKKIDDFVKCTEQFCYIFYLLHLPGMVHHRDYLLLDLNNSIKKVAKEANEDQIIESIDELFTIFADFKHSHIGLILDSILTLSKEIINTKSNRLIHYLEIQMIKFGFVNPGISYLTDEWELKVNPNHIKNIRVWLEIIEYNPEMMKKLLSALIINLRIGGIFIFDTNLFQKDVTQLLNTTISPIYKQIKQLTRIFPVYFNEIGAEGVLRDVSTKIDEMSSRNDKLIHFLRKQIHTEGNNSHIQMTYRIITFWHDLKIDNLKKAVPQNVIDNIEIDGHWVQGVHEALTKVCCKNKLSLDAFLSLENPEKLLDKIDHTNKDNLTRISLIIELYKLLVEKYSFETNNIIEIIKRHPFVSTEEILQLELLLEKEDNLEALSFIFTLMKKLNQIIFDPVYSEGWDNIYYKRHIAVGIPSMYGKYHEKKFEALGLTFRLERIASVLVGKIIKSLNTEYFTAKTLNHIFTVISLLREGLSLDGIYDQGFDSKLKMYQYSLKSGSFTINQYINLFEFMETGVREITNKYFIRPYEKLLEIIVPQYIKGKKVNNPLELKKIIIQKSEVFYRELLSSAFLIQSLDNFIGKVLTNLRKMSENLSIEEVHSIMTYNPELAFSPLYAETPVVDNQVYIGSKAYYLKSLYLLGYPVPPGFVITTEIFRRINFIPKLKSLSKEIDNFIKSHVLQLEKMAGLKFGDPQKPLLLSVRSGAAMSMPGAMNTFLNVGLNDEITETLSKQPNFGWTSWDCYRRLLQTWGMSFGINRNEFDQIMEDYKQKYNISQKLDFPNNIMRDMAYSYKQLLIDNNVTFESNPYLQLKQAILSVFRSWSTERAIVYREHLQIDEEWGTAVTVQQMVFGNIHLESGSGVFFTRDIQDNTPTMHVTGDFSFLSQGEDIVGGLINTLPMSERQRKKYYSKSPVSLESVFPDIYQRLKEISKELLEIHGFGHQEIEFTFETSDPKDLYILQTRDMLTNLQEEIMVFDVPREKMQKVGSGIGIGKGVLSGVIVFDHEDLIKLKKNHPDKKSILVRPDTVPDDIGIIIECDGLLTGKGGATSHAAVTASSLGKICIVNCVDLSVYEKEKKCDINGIVFNSFDGISIDGNNGNVFKGNYPIKIKEL
ncbi:MAG: PEP/pyruvate-binding domain-containing protein [Bacteroidales bacterium]|nr:PEP/pyruvate-binding domain-containing protein [Bacteroidales bacterium]MDD4217949.1 PEP/pyruvate-binding domain-containing protein [Bacteroidales bacterium]